MSRYHLLVTTGASLISTVLVACSTTVSPNTAPTVQAIATQAAPTTQSVATSGLATAAAVAPTVQAAATLAAPTVQAAATQAAPVAATAAASAPIRIAGVQTSSSDTTITLQNTSSSSVDLSNWTLQVGSATARLPAGVSVQAGQTATLHTASGTSNGADVYLGPAASDLSSQLRPGASVVLQNPSGTPATAFTIPAA